MLPGMIRGDGGVGGFLEDLPVLLFVLLGVFVLISSSIFSSKASSDAQEAEKLDAIAYKILNGILSKINSVDLMERTPSVASMKEMRLDVLREIHEQGIGYCVAVVMLHPCIEWLSEFTSGDPVHADCTGYARAMLNAVSDSGSIAVVEVQVIAWPS